MFKRTIYAVLCTVLLAGSLGISAPPLRKGMEVSAASENENADSQSKDGLVKEDGAYHYYEDGKLVKSSWRTIAGKKYYFKKNGDAAILSCKVKDKYYVFNAQGQLMEPSSTKVVKIETGGTVRKYRVKPDGTAAGGWDKDKTYYFYETGEMVRGIEVFKEKFYCFGAAGKYNEEKTKALRKAAGYEKPFADVKKLIGEPKKAAYYPSCYGAGNDGILTYENFMVYTFRPDSGAEIFMGAE